jgi:tripartite-type tricarboxylate transporter receptor subunit TctC
MQDLIGGRIDYFCTLTGTAVPHIEGGNVKAIGVFTRERAPMLPKVPSSFEQGFTAFEASTWFAFFLPAGTPEPIVQRLREATIAAMDTPAVQTQLVAAGAIVVPPARRSTEYLKRYVDEEIEKNAAPLRAAGIAMDSTALPPPAMNCASASRSA